MRASAFHLAAAAAVMTTAAALADDVPATAPQGADPHEVICKSASAGTGSMLGRRKICKTRTEWQQGQQQDREEIERAQSHSLMAHPTGG